MVAHSGLELENDSLQALNEPLVTSAHSERTQYLFDKGSSLLPLAIDRGAVIISLTRHEEDLTPSMDFAYIQATEMLRDGFRFFNCWSLPFLQSKWFSLMRPFRICT